MVSPRPSSRRNSSPVAQAGTSIALEIRTRGASSCVSKTPTALPDWTSIVWSERRRFSVATIESKPPSCARRGPCRRRRSARRASRRRPGRGCSRASGARLPAASPRQRSAGPRAARTVRAGERTLDAHARIIWAALAGARRRPTPDGELERRARSTGSPARVLEIRMELPVALSRLDDLGGRPPDALERRRGAPGAGGTPSPGRPAMSSIASTRSRFSTIAASLRAAIGDMETWSSLAADVGIESTDAGCARTLHSETSAAAVTCAIMRPEWRPALARPGTPAGPRARG